MMLEPLDWIVYIFLFFSLSIVFYLTVKGIFEFHYRFLLASGVIGLFMLWSIYRDPSSLSVWIQAGATLMLLVITGMATYATIVMAEANQNLLQLTLKEQKKNLVIETSKNLIQEIEGVIKWERDFL